MVRSKDRRSAQGAYLIQCSDVFKVLQRLAQGRVEEQQPSRTASESKFDRYM